VAEWQTRQSQNSRLISHLVILRTN